MLKISHLQSSKMALMIWSHGSCRRLEDLRSSNQTFPEVKASFPYSHLRLFVVLSCCSNNMPQLCILFSVLIEHSGCPFHEITAVSPAEM